MTLPVHIGCSGFNYAHWRGTFYPEKLAQRHWLSHYCSVFSCVELNVTFYRLLPPRTFEKWYAETPSGFVFAVKGSRYISHIRRLNEPEEPLARFFESALQLQEKLAVVLWQFPPQFAVEYDRLAHFLACLGRYRVRTVLEFRHESWLDGRVVELCRGENVALCLADVPPFLAHAPLTADFVYLRRHGVGGRYQSFYTTEELEEDARTIRAFTAGGREVHIYFNNDYQGYAPQNARELAAMLAV